MGQFIRVPSSCATAETFGDLIHWHPHIHAIGDLTVPQAVGASGVWAAPERGQDQRIGRGQHPFPEMGEHLIRYYGWYSNKKRGQRAQVQPPPPEGSAAPPRAPSAREAANAGPPPEADQSRKRDPHHLKVCFLR
jgi:hypothetical protein